MSTTFNIPLTTLQVGSRDLGPTSPKNIEQSILLTVDRTVAGGLNSLGTDSSIEFLVMQSNDGGATWILTVGGSMPGGVFTDKLGATIGVSTLRVDLFPGTSRQLKATVTVSGPSPIAVAGTLVTT